jgi:hypothetical protein
MLDQDRWGGRLMTTEVNPSNRVAQRDKLLLAACADGSSLPLPGSGDTAQRHRVLYEWARADLSFARLMEAHCDAIAILAEAGRRPRCGSIYGVWASESPAYSLEMSDRDSWTVDGRKAFCTGAGIVDRALVTVPSSDGELLIDVDVKPSSSLSFESSSWVVDAFTDTHTASALFSGVAVMPEDVVGDPGFYTRRVGFWHGALGPACCWAGGAAGLVDAAMKAVADRVPDAVSDIHVGRLDALRWRMECVLDGAAGEIDGSPDDFGEAYRRALRCRHEIDIAAGAVVDEFSRLLGPRPLAFDRALSTRVAEVQLYRRQCHAERDLAQLGRSALAERAPIPL